MPNLLLLVLGTGDGNYKDSCRFIGDRESMSINGKYKLKGGCKYSRNRECPTNRRWLF